MRSITSLLLLVAVLQLSRSQKIKDLTACLSNQTLRIDCAYEQKTASSVSYEFRMSRDTREGMVVAGNWSVQHASYRLRTNITVTNNLVCLHLSSFTTADEGVYTCRLKVTNPDTVLAKNISVVKANLERCAGISLFLQNTSWLLLLLLSLPLLQAVDFVSL